MGDIDRLTTFLQLDKAVVELQQWNLLVPSILQRAIEFERFKSQIVVLEVNLEQANRNAEQRVTAAEEELAEKARELEQLHSHASTQHTPSAQDTQRIETLEKENKALENRIQALLLQNTDLSDGKRQALALVDRQNRATENIESEYKALSKRNQELRKTTVELEKQVREARTQASNSQVRSEQYSKSFVLIFIVQGAVDSAGACGCTEECRMAQYRAREQVQGLCKLQERDGHSD